VSRLLPIAPKTGVFFAIGMAIVEKSGKKPLKLVEQRRSDLYHDGPLPTC